MPPQTDHATRKLRAAAARDLKNGLQVGKGELVTDRHYGAIP